MFISQPRTLLVLTLVAGLGVCAAAQTAKPNAKTIKKVRVFFVEPKNSAKVTSPVHMKFGSEGIEISPVPARRHRQPPSPGVAHYHVGIDQTVCPPGRPSSKGRRRGCISARARPSSTPS